jgi:nucleoside-diphosphate-sugar epimerase
MDILIIGGTRNVGHFLTLELLKKGHRVTVFNRGKTPDELPPEVQRLQGDRSDPHALSRALAGRSFDVVVDMALYNATDAKVIAELLDGRTGGYLFLSTGQVYLVREECPRPFIETATEKPLLPAPLPGTRNHDEWLYGVNKSQAEAIMMEAWQAGRFSVTILRLPMVNSERDHFHRVHGYLLRMRDGGPILLPTGKHLRLRHVYAGDVVQAIMRVIQTGSREGRAYNISQDETVTIDDFLFLLAAIAGHDLKLKYIDRAVLESLQLLPDCSPFSDPWMSELDNQRSKLELGMQYTPLAVYLETLVRHYGDSQRPLPDGYQRRTQEIRLASGA